jgi:electron transfer flavoprotein alpha/beta subunit
MRILVLLRGWRRTPDGALDIERIGQYERIAIGTALALRDGRDGDVTVRALAAGSEAEDEALAVAHALGAEKTFRVWDPILGDIDALGVAQALSQAAQHEGFDLLLAGFRSPDHRQGFMGPAVADCLSIPHLTGALELRWKNGGLEAVPGCDSIAYTQRLDTPCLVTLAGGPDPGTAKPTESHQPKLLTLDDIGLDAERLRPRVRLQGKIVASTRDAYVTAFVDDAATVVEHLHDVDAFL